VTDLRRPELMKNYEPAAVEPRIYAQWLAAGVFHEEPDPARPPFIISMPPPNITGRAHIGHGSTYTPMDSLTRYHRMLGENANWIPGQDHAAIATESVVVRELAREGRTRESLGREAFIARVWEWRAQYGGIIDEQFKALGFGPDWERERFTLDPGLSAAVIRVFIDLYEDGLIYRGTRLVNWDPKAQSTLSDAGRRDRDDAARNDVRRCRRRCPSRRRAVRWAHRPQRDFTARPARHSGDCRHRRRAQFRHGRGEGDARARRNRL